MTEPLFNLKDLAVHEVSLVTRPANKRKFMLLKNEGGILLNQKLFDAITKVDLEVASKLGEVMKEHSVEEEAASAVEAAVKLVVAYSEELPENIFHKLSGILGEVVDKQDKTEEKEEETKREKEIEIKETDENDIFKGLDVPENLRPALDAITKAYSDRISEMQNALEAEKDKQATAQFVAKASEFDALAVNPQEFGLVLKNIYTANPEEYQRIEAVLKAANKAVSESALFINKGSASADGGLAIDEITSLANTLVEKSEHKVTFEQAYAQVLSSRPDLYDRIQRGE